MSAVLVCALCHKPNVTEESRCFGCGELICDKCDQSPPMGSHAREDHLFDMKSFDSSGNAKRWALRPEVQCEVDNFCNTLLNLLERSEPEPGNFDLIGG